MADPVPGTLERRAPRKANRNFWVLLAVVLVIVTWGEAHRVAARNSLRQNTADEATPNHNAVAAQNLIRLAVLAGDDASRQKADRLIGAIAPLAAENLYMHMALLNAIDLRLRAAQIVVTGEGPGADALLAAARKLPSLDRIVLHAGKADALSSAHPARDKIAAAKEPEAEIGGEADRANHDDAGEHPFGPKCLLRVEDHVTETAGRTNHLGGDNNDQRNAPGQPHAGKDMRQAARQHDAFEDFKLAGAERARCPEQIGIDASDPRKGVENDRK